MLRASRSLVALLLLAAPAVTAARDAAPPEAVAKECDRQARSEVGSPPVSPRAQANASAPSDDTLQRARSEDQPPRRETQKTPGSDPREAYRIAYEACLRARAH